MELNAGSPNRFSPANLGRHVRRGSARRLLRDQGRARKAKQHGEVEWPLQKREGAQTAGTNWRVGRIIWQGVDHVLRPMREPAHPWGAILHEVREGGTAGRRGDIFSDDGASGRFHWSLRGVYRNLCGAFRSLWGEGRHDGRGACSGQRARPTGACGATSKR